MTTEIQKLGYLEIFINPENGRISSHYLNEKDSMFIDESGYLKNHSLNLTYVKEIIAEILGIGGNEVHFSNTQVRHISYSSTEEVNIKLSNSFLFKECKMP